MLRKATTTSKNTTKAPARASFTSAGFEQSLQGAEVIREPLSLPAA